MPKRLHKRPLERPTVFQGMITTSPQMREFFSLIERAAKSDSNVLVRGESGTGKELVARAIHNLSVRVKGPFYALNCATLSSELMQSELFGHVKGAFTGAISDKKGLFEAANQGTLFLDEVAELPLELQPRLLRVIQDRQFSRVGSFKALKANVRIVSATHKSLRHEVQVGHFRGDLMYRLRVVPIFLPRLAERGRDLEILAWSFIDEFNRNRQRIVTAIADDALEAMYRYPWPGNIRELRNNIEYAFVMGEGDVLSLDDLTPELREESPPHTETVTRTLQQDEIQAIRDALRSVGNKRGLAAKKLGMSRSTLWRKLREYQLQ